MEKENEDIFKHLSSPKLFVPTIFLRKLLEYMLPDPAMRVSIREEEKSRQGTHSSTGQTRTAQQHHWPRKREGLKGSSYVHLC